MARPISAAEGATPEAGAAGSPAQAAWLRYRRTLEEQRERFLKHDFASDPLLRAQGLYFLQSQEVSAFNLYVAPRQQYPALYVQSFFMPIELSWGLPNPDFVNHNGFLDGAHTYRIHGNRRGSYWSTLQVFRGFWGDEVQGTLAHVDFDELPESADGRFEIFLGPNPPAQPDGRHWVKLDPGVRNVMLALRETFYDWQRDQPLELHIEILDRDPAAPVTFDEAELAARIEKARKWTIANFELAMRGASPRPPNQFVLATGARQQGGNPLGSWLTMLYEVKPDEALILEMPVIEARYWGFQLGSVWGQTTDYSYHQSSLNGAQARLDADGRFRAVLALEDPGVPNWLDPAGVPKGMALLRFYKSDDPVVPTVARVKRADVRRHLPPDTPVVAPEQRRRELEARRIASLRRYGQ